MTAAFALLACVAWGYSTHAAARGARAWGALRLTACSQVAGLGVLVPWSIVAGGAVGAADVRYGMLAGLGSGSSLALLYDACLRMPAGLAAAISGVMAAVVPLLATTVTDASLSPLAEVSMLSCVAGVTIIALAQPAATGAGVRARSHLGACEAGLSGAAMGIYYVALALVHDPAVGVTEARVVASLLLLAAVMAKVGRRSGSARAPVATALLVGVSGAVGAIAYGCAIGVSQLVSVVAIVSMSPVVTAALGRWRAADHLSAAQACGLIACVAGAALSAISIIGR